MTEELRQQANEIFEELGLTNGQLLEAWTAYEANPKGTLSIATKAFQGERPAGLFLYGIRKGAHHKPVAKKGQRTGWRFVRGSHSGTYVRDVKGTDVLPSGHEQ